MILLTKNSMKNMIFILFGIFAIFTSTSSLTKCNALEATFTPAPDKDTGKDTGGPLPQSQNQRDQLTKLDQMIAQSPQPQETLMKVAESNGMTPEELGDLLMRNRRDMQMAQGGSGFGVGAGTSIPRQILRIGSTAMVLLVKSATAHPRHAALTSLALLAIAYVAISAPRNGVVLVSSRSGYGYTTLLPPPNAHLQTYLSKNTFQDLECSMPPQVKPGSLSRAFIKGGRSGLMQKGTNRVGDGGDEGNAIVQKLTKKQKKTISMAITSRRNVPFEVLLPSEEELEILQQKEIDSGTFADAEDEDSDMIQFIQDKAWEDCIAIAFSSGESILSARRFTEYIPEPSNRLRLVAKPDKSKNDVALVVSTMGAWRRYGIQPLRVAYEEGYDRDDDDDDENLCRSVVFYTLKGGHFDGEIMVSVEKYADKDDQADDDEAGITVAVTLLSPKNNRRKINERLASNIVSLMTDSIVHSTMTAARQVQSRRLQSTIYRGRAKSRATEKRHIAFENVKKMEEMARDRRRRWQRTSGANAGRYRPTGVRRPEGGPSRSF